MAHGKKYRASVEKRNPMETYPLEKAGVAYERMISNKARFRVVLTP